MKEISDHDLIQGLRKKDPHIYEIVFMKYYPLLVVFITRQVGDQDVAKDFVQDIFFKLYELAPSIPKDFNLKSWLYKVARNMAVDHLRHLQVVDRHKFLMGEAMLATADVDECIDEELCKKINLAVESLPEQCRLIIKMNVIEGKKYLEIADELGITINTIRTQVSRGYKKLRDILSGENDVLVLLFALQLRHYS